MTLEEERLSVFHACEVIFAFAKVAAFEGKRAAFETLVHAHCHLKDRHLILVGLCKTEAASVQFNNN